MKMMIMGIINFIRQLIRNDKDIKELEKNVKLSKKTMQQEKKLHMIYSIMILNQKNEFIPTLVLTEYTKSYLDDNGIKKTEEETFMIRDIATTHLCELINKNTIYKAFVEFGEGETHLRVMKKICLIDE